MGKLRINRDLRNDTLIIECDYTKYVIIQHAITRRITAFRNTHRAGVEVENLPAVLPLADGYDRTPAHRSGLKQVGFPGQKMTMRQKQTLFFQ